jgi:apolipoprotein N-acyltransferase
VQLIVRCAWCLAAGLGTSLAFPPHDLWWVVWVSIAPWLASLRGTRPREALLLSAIFGLSLALPLGGWIPSTIAEGFRGSLAGGFGLWLLAGLSYQPALLLLAWCLRRVPADGGLYPLCAGAGWGIVELSYSFVWPQVPWVLLGATQIDTPVAALAGAVGVHGVSVLIVTWNALLAQVLCRSATRSLAYVAAALAMAAMIGAGLGARGEAQGAGALMRVALVQPAVSVRQYPDSLFQDASATALAELTRELPQVDLVLWPENALNGTLEGRPDLAQQISALAQEIEAPIWLGVHRGSSASRQNGIARIAPGMLW